MAFTLDVFMISDIRSPKADINFGVDGTISSNRAPSLRAVLWEGPSSASTRRLGESAEAMPLNSIGASILTREIELDIC
jgi:hypothetical protein